MLILGLEGSNSSTMLSRVQTYLWACHSLSRHYCRHSLFHHRTPTLLKCTYTRYDFHGMRTCPQGISMLDENNKKQTCYDGYRIPDNCEN